MTTQEERQRQNRDAQRRYRANNREKARAASMAATARYRRTPAGKAAHAAAEAARRARVKEKANHEAERTCTPNDCTDHAL